LNIIFVSTMDSVPWGGSEELWSRTALQLATEHRVAACVEHWSIRPQALVQLEASNSEVFYRRPTNRTLMNRVVHKLKNGAPDRAVLGEASKWLEKQQADLVCLSLGNCREGLMWLNLLVRLKVPYVILVHGVYETLWPDDSLAAELRAFYLTAKKCCFVSQRNRELFEDMIGTVLPDAQVVRNPFNVSYEAKPAWPSSDPHWRLAMVGRLEPHTKAHDILFKVLADEKWRTRNLRVACYGSGEHFGDNVKRLAERYAPDMIEFPGHQNDVEKIWSENHALAMPSRCEGMPLALVEAMLCGRPAIVTDIAGHTELVAHGENGFVAKAPTVELFDEAL